MDIHKSEIAPQYHDIQISQTANFFFCPEMLNAYYIYCIYSDASPECFDFGSSLRSGLFWVHTVCNISYQRLRQMREQTIIVMKDGKMIGFCNVFITILFHAIKPYFLRFYSVLFEPRCEKTCLRGFRQSEIQTSWLSYRD